MGKLLITGARGNVGGYAAKYAIENGQEVVVAGSNIEALKRKFGEKAQAVFFDFTDSKTFEVSLEGVDRVFIMRPPQLGRPQDLKPFVQALKAKGNIKLV